MMQGQTEKQATKRTRTHAGEAFLCIFLAFFMVFEIALISILTVRALSGDEPSRPAQPPVGGPPSVDPPAVTDSIFANGVLPVRPTNGADTKVMGGEVTSQFAILINADTGEVIAVKDPDTRFSPASMTKVMTLIVACERLTAEDLNRRIPLTQEIADYVRTGSYAGTSVSLPLESNGYTCIGDEYYIKDLLYGIGVASAADCTYMIVKEVAASEEAFVALMNQKAQEMGLTDTHFDNAVGFDSAENYTTAREMAMMMSYAMQCDMIAEVLQARTTDYVIKGHYSMDGAEKNYPVTLKNSLSGRLEKYPTFHLNTAKLTATKTGYTDQSFMVAAAEGLESHARYVLVLGNQTSSATTVTEKFRNTMIDIELILNTYSK